jgi:hypothetical protein
VVVDEGGKFLKVANCHYEVGQTVTEVLPMQVPPQKKKPAKWMYSLAAMAACLVLLVTTLLPTGHQPYASVYVKINPEVRIDVDKQDIVVGLTGVNQDGIDLLQGYDYQNKHLDLVTDELVDRAIEMGYLKPEGKITISLDSQDQTWVQDHTDKISQQLQNHLQEQIVVNIEIKLCTHEHPGKDHSYYEYDDDDDDDYDDHDDHDDDDHDDHDDHDDDEDDNRIEINIGEELPDELEDELEDILDRDDDDDDDDKDDDDDDDDDKDDKDDDDEEDDDDEDDDDDDDD